MTVAFRSAEGKADRAFIVGTWSDSYKSSHYAGMLWTDDYAPTMHVQIERVLDRPETVAIVACDRDDSSFLFGHIVGEVEPGETPIVHYTYVKAPYRRTGIARGLLTELGIAPFSYFVYTCNTGIASDLKNGVIRDKNGDIVGRCPSKIPRSRFDPNGIRYSRTNRRRAL